MNDDRLQRASNYLRYPIVCAGDCRAKCGNADEMPEQITHTDADHLNGWTFTNDPRFSYDGEYVWVCPECSKRFPPTAIRFVLRYGALQREA